MRIAFLKGVILAVVCFIIKDIVDPQTIWNAWHLGAISVLVVDTIIEIFLPDKKEEE